MLHFGKIPKKKVTFGENSAKFWQNLRKICEILEKTANNSAIFNENFEIRERCRGVAAVPEASRAGRGAAPLRRAGARVAGHLHHHQAGPRGLAPRGRAAARFGLVASGVCRFARAR